MQNTLFTEEGKGVALEEMPVSVGQLLKEARESLGISLEAASRTLRIGRSHLSKLETDDKTLICDVYTLGFLRSYAKFLELDANTLISKFKKSTDTTLPPSLVFPNPTPERGIPTFRVLLTSSLLFLCITGAASYYWWKSKSSSPEILSELSDMSLPASLDPVPQPLPMPSEAPAPLLEAAPPSTFLKIIEKTWVDVRQEDGTIVLRRLLYPGHVYEFKNPSHLILKVGHAQGVQLTSQDKTLSFPNIEGVKGGIPLNSLKWAQDLP